MGGLEYLCECCINHCKEKNFINVIEQDGCKTFKCLQFKKDEEKFKNLISKEVFTYED